MPIHSLRKRPKSCRDKNIRFSRLTQRWEWHNHRAQLKELVADDSMHSNNAYKLLPKVFTTFSLSLLLTLSYTQRHREHTMSYQDLTKPDHQTSTSSKCKYNCTNTAACQKWDDQPLIRVHYGAFISRLFRFFIICCFLILRQQERGVATTATEAVTRLVLRKYQVLQCIADLGFIMFHRFNNSLVHSPFTSPDDYRIFY